MRRLERCWAAFREDLIDFAFMIDDVLHGRWDGPDVIILPPPDRVVEAPLHRCTKADLTAVAILDFLGTQKKKSTVFDGYVAAEKRREVSTDE
jgi:hypothetical protein